jgi:hypothetical protein
MGGKDEKRAIGSIVNIFNEDRALAAQFIHHEAIMDNLMAHIYRSAINLQRPLNDLDSPIHPGAEAARTG